MKKIITSLLNTVNAVQMNLSFYSAKMLQRIQMNRTNIVLIGILGLPGFLNAQTDELQESKSESILSVAESDEPASDNRNNIAQRANGCDTLHTGFLAPYNGKVNAEGDPISDTTLVIPRRYSHGGGDTYDGFMFGHHEYKPVKIVQRYVNNTDVSVMGARFYFPTQVEHSGVTTNGLKIVVYTHDDATNGPGQEVYSKVESLSEIVQRNSGATTANSFVPTDVYFDTAVAVGNKDFYVGIEINYSNPEDKVVIGTQTDSDRQIHDTYLSTLGGVYFFLDGSTEHRNIKTDPTRWYTEQEMWYLNNLDNLGYALHIFPWITETPPRAVISPEMEVCQGTTVDFDGSSSENASSYNWTISGSDNPSQSTAAPSAKMTSAGDQKIYLTVGNGCGFSHRDSITIVIGPGPDVKIASGTTTICPGETIDFVASGADSYVWTGPGLSCTDCLSPNASPTDPETVYKLKGNIGVCEGEDSIKIEVVQAPVAAFTTTRKELCVGQDKFKTSCFDGEGSLNTHIYKWTLENAAITNATKFDPKICAEWLDPGDYRITLEVQNLCGESDAKTIDLKVYSSEDCPFTVGIDENSSTLNYEMSYFPDFQYLNVNFLQNSKEPVTVELISMTGQVVTSRNLGIVQAGQIEEISTSNLLPAVYLLKVSVGEKQSVSKIAL